MESFHNKMLWRSLSVNVFSFITRPLYTSAYVLAGPQARQTIQKYDVERLPEYQFDDMTSTGQEILMAQREVRKYLRKSKYELPLLKKYAETYTPPSPSHILLFETGYLMGESSPIRERSVKLTVSMPQLIKQLGLTKVQARKLILISGKRFQLPNNIIKFDENKFPFQGELVFKCNRFQYRAQNKKYLSDLFDRLVAEAKNDTDTFENIPIDLRHIKPRRPKPVFPKEWLQLKKKNEETPQSDAKKDTSLMSNPAE